MNDTPVHSRMGTRKAVAAATEYLRGRQSYNGGFCFYRCEYLDEPNLSDSYHAVAGLRLLGASVPYSDRLDQFLHDFAPAGTDALYFHTFTLDLLGHAPRIDGSGLSRVRDLHISTLHRQDGKSLSGSLKTSLRVLRLKQRFAVLENHLEFMRLVESLKSKGGYGIKPNLQDTYLCLSIRALLTEDPKEAGIRSFVDDLQIPSIGFTSTRDSRVANLDLLYAGIRCCDILDLPIRYADDVLSFVLFCQAANGGFSAAPTALPNIELTHKALQIIERLDRNTILSESKGQ